MESYLILTLIIPTNNRGLILKSLLSKLTLQHGKFEVVIVDDASIDNTEEIVKDKSKDLNFGLTYIKLKYQIGLPSARNVGLKFAKYDFIGYLDDDCIPIRKDLLSRAYKWLSLNNEGIVGVGGPVYRQYDSSESVESKSSIINFFHPSRWIKLFLTIIDTISYNPKELTFTNSIPGGNCFFNKRIVLKCGGFDPIYGGNFYREETDLCIRIKRYGKLVFDPKMPVNHLFIDYGGCRRSIDKLYSNIFTNTILLILKNKKILLEVILDIVKHSIGFIYSFMIGKDQVKRVKLIKSLLISFKLGFQIKNSLVNNNKPNIAEVFENNISNISTH